MKKMKTAIVGCGVISEIYLRSFQKNFSVIEVTACSDIDRKKMEDTALKYHIKPMSWGEILLEKEIEMVINLTNPNVHFALTREAIVAGKHVFSEKMMAVDFTEGKELCDLAKEYNVRLGAAPDTFLGGGIQTALDSVQRGLAGNILSGVVSLTRDYRIFGEILPHLNKAGGTVLYDMGCYYLTALCSILGPAERISAFGKIHNPLRKGRRIGGPLFDHDIHIEDNNIITAIIEFKMGALITVHLNSECILNETFHLELYGDRGILKMGDPNGFDGKTVLQIAGSDQVSLPMTHGYQEQSRGIGAAEMAWSIFADRPHRAGMELALHVLEIIHGIGKSAGSGNIYEMTTFFSKPDPLPEGFINNGFWGATEESALV